VSSHESGEGEGVMGHLRIRVACLFATCAVAALAACGARTQLSSVAVDGDVLGNDASSGGGDGGRLCPLSLPDPMTPCSRSAHCCYFPQTFCLICSRDPDGWYWETAETVPEFTTCEEWQCQALQPEECIQDSGAACCSCAASPPSRFVCGPC
jgi:hypothetical protein